MPAWVIVTVLPAIVSVPLRDEVELFALTENATVPLPEPVLPLVTVIQDALLTAVQAQPVTDDTPTDPLPLVDATEIEVADSV
jgi:hypothetical protein